jgi:hypothetical protein
MEITEEFITDLNEEYFKEGIKKQPLLQVLLLSKTVMAL